MSAWVGGFARPAGWVLEAGCSSGGGNSNYSSERCHCVAAAVWNKRIAGQDKSLKAAFAASNGGDGNRLMLDQQCVPLLPCLDAAAHVAPWGAMSYCGFVCLG